MRFKIADETELDYAASVYNLSGYHYDSDANLKGGDHLINDTRGYSAIVQPLAKTLKDVRLNQSVESITEGNGKYVTVKTRAGLVIEADYVIIAASLGTLKRNLITFTPGLPVDLNLAIKNMGCDVSDKVVMHFPPNSSHTWGGAKRDVFYHIAEESDGHTAGQVKK